jgi:hypothetical protein
MLLNSITLVQKFPLSIFFGIKLNIVFFVSDAVNDSHLNLFTEGKICKKKAGFVSV